jgi:hypothetical protein
MALDGPKIIDGDLANDIYIEFMDLYDSDFPVSEIISTIEKWQSNLVDEIEEDIFFTTYAQCLWEIGQTSEKLIDQIERSYDEETYLKFWKSECGEEWYCERKKILRKFISKIRKERSTPRKRKKYHKVKNFIFQVGDIISCEFSGGNHFAFIISDVSQTRNECAYSFCPINYDKDIPATQADAQYCFGHRIPSSLSSKGFEYGFWMNCIVHKDLLKYRDKLKKVGHLALNNDLYKSGVIGYFGTIEDLEKSTMEILKPANRTQNNMFQSMEFEWFPLEGFLR